MTDKVNPSVNRPADAFKTAGAISQAGASSTGYIAPASSPTEISTQDGEIDETQFNEFTQSSSSSSFEVTIDAGEGFVYGSWLAIDVSTTVTLASSTTNQTVYVGWNKDGSDDVIIGLDSAFASASGDTDKKIPLFDFDTDGGGVTSVTDRRTIGRSVSISDETQLTANSDDDIVSVDPSTGDTGSVPFGDINLGADDILNVGHDETDLPQSVDRTVADFEGGTLPQDAVGDTGDASVQSSVVLEGDYSLEISPSSSAPSTVGFINRPTTPQIGDTATASVYLTDEDDLIKIGYLRDNVSEPYYNGTGFIIEVRPVNNSLTIRNYVGGEQISDKTVYADFSSHLNEKLDVLCELSSDRNAFISVTNSNDEIVSDTFPVANELPTSGNISVRAGNNSTTPPTQYFDGPFITRREPEDRRNTQKGETQLGNHAVGTGGGSFGPPATHQNARRGRLGEAPVDSDATQGQQSIIQLLKSAGLPTVYVERIFDGQGGAYGHQLEASAGRFLRKSSQLDWDQETLSKVPYWDTARSASNFDFALTDTNPSRIQVKHDGSASSDSFGGFKSSVLLTAQTLGAYRLTFHNVSFTNNGTSTGFNEAFIGVSTVSADSQPADSGNGFFWELQPWDSVDEAALVNNGSASDQGGTDIDWSTTHNLTVEYNGSEVRWLVDGERISTASYSTNADFTPIITLEDNSNSSASETLEVQDVSLEPLEEVLQ